MGYDLYTGVQVALRLATLQPLDASDRKKGLRISTGARHVVGHHSHRGDIA